jgi:HD superfamily phosphodiesterase
LDVAIILHDIGQAKQVEQLKKSKNQFKSIPPLKYGGKLVDNFLKDEGFPKRKIDKVKEIIGSHGSQGQRGSFEGAILHDADLLDGIGLAGAIRRFSYGALIGRDLSGTIKFIKKRFETDPKRFRTKTGKKLGMRQLRQVKTFIKQLEEELKS